MLRFGFISVFVLVTFFVTGLLQLAEWIAKLMKEPVNPIYLAAGEICAFLACLKLHEKWPTLYIYCGTINTMKRGRPPKPASERRSVMLRHRLTKSEYKKLCADAKRAGLSVSEYARKVLGGGK